MHNYAGLYLTVKGTQAFILIQRKKFEGMISRESNCIDIIFSKLPSPFYTYNILRDRLGHGGKVT